MTEQLITALEKIVTYHLGETKAYQGLIDSSGLRDEDRGFYRAQRDAHLKAANLVSDYLAEVDS